MNGSSFFPRLILIGDGFTREAVSDAIVAAVRGGVRWVHLRDHAARTNAFELVVPTITAQIRSEAVDVAVSINGRLTVAKHLSLHYHARTHPDSVAEARRELGPSAVVGFSAHDLAGAEDAVEAGADYVLLSPIFPTTSKPDARAIGLDALRACSEALGDAPVYALGGITPDNAAACLAAGAYGVAVLSGILHADDPEAAAGRYLTAIDGRAGDVPDESSSSTTS